MNKDEERIYELLNSYKLICERFSKKEKHPGKTPDFRVFQDGELKFFCEVKSIDVDSWLDKQLDAAPSGVVVGGLRNDPIYNRLTSDVHAAVKQFDAVNEDLNHPNVLALANHDKKCGFIDLIAVITGYALTNEGGPLPFFGKFSKGRIRLEKERIHLFIWKDDFKPKQFLLSQSHTSHHDTLCNIFGINPNSIKQIGS
jgi:hypothetical protein